MFISIFPEMVYVHVKDDIQKHLEEKPDHKKVFEALVVGVNVQSLEDYERVAKAVLSIPDGRIRNTTREEFVRCALNGQDFIDRTGDLV